MNNQYHYADILVDRAVDTAYTYEVPLDLKDQVGIGKRVRVSLRSATIIGCIVNLHNQKPDYPTKTILSIIDQEAIISQKSLELAKWIADYYQSPLGQTLFTMLPKEIKSKASVIPLSPQSESRKLSSEQKICVDQIKSDIDRQKASIYLLYGVTGSGKTEVYKALSKMVAALGKMVLILVPEIALTPQTIRRFSSIFGDRIAVYHSSLTQKEKLYHYKRIQNKQVDCILGARSAIFTPNQDWGLIVIDEEHENSYKSADTPRYHARQIAMKLSNDLSIPLILGSATPSVESYYHAKERNISLLEINERYSTYPIKASEIIDMRMENKNSIFSKQLVIDIAERLGKKEQTILFLNRRGYSPIQLCTDCGFHPLCPACDISLTYHDYRNLSLCHYCGYSEKPMRLCSNCNSAEISHVGMGTEKIEMELKALFPQSIVVRMDKDTISRKHSHAKILDSFSKGHIDILVGTQMIAKGLHFPNVTLVGVISADITLHLPDFRSAERTFSLLTQVSGRSGRGLKEGKVLIQTYLPDHFVIECAGQQDYLSFYEKEIKLRQQYKYPPFSRLARLLARGKNEQEVRESMVALAGTLRKSIGPWQVEMLGPVPAAIPKLKYDYRYQILIKSFSGHKALKHLCGVARQAFVNSKRIYLEIDIDPMQLL